MRFRRVGFPVDAAIVGFAVGTGFALVENTYYLLALESPGVAALAGTRIRCRDPARHRHGDCRDHGPGAGGTRHGQGWRVFVPGALAAIVIHGIYNQFVLSAGRCDAAAADRAAAAAARHLHSERARDARVDERRAGSRRRTPEAGAVGDFGQTRLGAYLQELRSRFPGPVVADMFCLMRVELELGIRAKGMLMARDAGLDVPLDDEVHAALAEVRYLEKAIGPTGLLALTPLQVSSRPRRLAQVPFERAEKSKGGVVNAEC